MWFLQPFSVVTKQTWIETYIPLFIKAVVTFRNVRSKSAAHSALLSADELTGIIIVEVKLDTSSSVAVAVDVHKFDSSLICSWYGRRKNTCSDVAGVEHVFCFETELIHLDITCIHVAPAMRRCLPDGIVLSCDRMVHTP